MRKRRPPRPLRIRRISSQPTTPCENSAPPKINTDTRITSDPPPKGQKLKRAAACKNTPLCREPLPRAPGKYYFRGGFFKSDTFGPATQIGRIAGKQRFLLIKNGLGDFSINLALNGLRFFRISMRHSRRDRFKGSGDFIHI